MSSRQCRYHSLTSATTIKQHTVVHHLVTESLVLHAEVQLFTEDLVLHAEAQPVTDQDPLKEEVLLAKDATEVSPGLDHPHNNTDLHLANSERQHAVATSHLSEEVHLRDLASLSRISNLLVKSDF